MLADRKSRVFVAWDGAFRGGTFDRDGYGILAQRNGSAQVKGRETMNFWRHVEQAIADNTGEPFVIKDHHGVGGGCINEAWVLEGEGRDYFIKTNRAEMVDMFAAEAEGLQAMADTQTIGVPRPVCWGAAEDRAWLVMEHVPMGGRANGRLFGERLARMHLAFGERFGWHRDNTIGSTPQPNAWADDWVDFWRRQRLGHQLALAASNGIGARVVERGELLKDKFGDFLAGYAPKPSPLHGDLWSGNWSFDRQGDPVIFDPAFYFGDHEADLAMMELFGNPGADFHAAYRDVFPVDAGYPLRRELYNLYHILNHYNLFGGSYGNQAGRMIDRLLAELI